MNARAQQLLNTRYGSDALPAPAAWSPVIDHLLGHRSVRRYLPDPVGDDQLTAIVAAAQSAATSSNLQAWSVVAVRSAETRAALAEVAGGQAHVRAAPLQLVWLADLARLAHVAEGAGRPHGALDYLEMFVIGAVDAALAAQNALAAAESLGLSGCYIGGLRNQPERVAELLGLPPRVFAVFGMTLGVEDPAAPPAAAKPRLPQSVVLHRERYRPVAEQQPGIEAYNQAMARFYIEQKMDVHGTWAVHSAKRIAGPEAMTGRGRLAEALHGLGFPLK
ncbi:nitroreductase family protein [Pseudothauera rhizosphaerae]|uniref:NADPH-dependent oxidoreductase n=1 Tax=Pseudothauera rhizosphaerae TaxID=2565932 RepID=A0A4V3WAH4_9RHOO|nr:nitroreductase family protein [Pseudothauera rhizosphaerae]THF59281.1 NADPH-dependent oxidoreductase [Pseudothauera rhizosphaerae]